MLTAAVQETFFPFKVKYFEMAKPSRNRGASKPRRYYQELRQSPFPYRSAPDASTVEIDVELNENGDKETLRLMHLAQIMPFIPSPFFVYLNAPALLAVEHFNERSNVVVPDLSERLEGCNIHMTLDLLNSQLNPLLASSKLYEYFLHEPTLQKPHPAALLGSALSSISRQLAVLTGTYEIPQISFAATSSLLDNKGNAPTFGRTIPTNRGEAEAIAVYLKDRGISHFCIFHVRDDYGTAFQRDLAAAADRHGIRRTSVSYEENDVGSITRALGVVKASSVRYICGIMLAQGAQEVLELAYDAGVIGEDYSWIVQGLDENQGYSLNRQTEAKFAAAIQGTVLVGLEGGTHNNFEASLSKLQTDSDFQSFFLESHPDASAYENVNLADMPVGISSFSYFAYDAVMALGIAACQMEEPFFKGLEFFEEVKRTVFNGASGPVAFELETGTRRYDTLAYSFTNLFMNETKSSNNTAVFDTRVATVVNFSSSQIINDIHPVIYFSGNTTAPKALPNLDIDMNLISFGAITSAFTCIGWTMLACLGCAWWVYKKKKTTLVRSAQPFFLWMLLTGTFIMASSVIPMAFQEPMATQSGLDAACMASPWLFVCGFSIAFSTISTKCWRISIVVRESIEMRRVNVRPVDVILPFVILSAVNVTLLTAWTLNAPLVWARVAVSNYDEFGRSVESYGSCRGSDGDEENGWGTSVIFISCLVVINVCIVASAFLRAFQTRHLPSQFNEAGYMTVCMVIILEAFFLGLPIMFLSGANPTAFFLIRAFLVVALCCAILGPNFLPKILWLCQTGDASQAILQRQFGSFIANRASSSSSSASRRQKTRLSMTNSRGGRQGSSGTLAAFNGDQSENPARPPVDPIAYYASSVSQLRASIARKQSEVPTRVQITSSGDEGESLVFEEEPIAYESRFA